MRNFFFLCGFSLLALLACSTPQPVHMASPQIDLYASRNDRALAHVLAEARAQRQTHPEIKIVIHLPDQLNMPEPILIGRADSGNPGAPLVIEGAQGGSTISGSDELQGSELRPAEPAALLFAPSAAPNIREVQLPQGSSPSVPTLFDADGRVTPARLPETGYLHSSAAYLQNGRAYLRLAPSLITALSSSSAPRIAGYFHYDWLFETFSIRIEDAQTISFQAPQFGVGPTQRFFFQNVPSGLRQAGQFYFDPPSGKLYFISHARHIVRARAHELLVVNSAHDVILRGIKMQETAQSAMSINNSRNVDLEQCSIQHAAAAINVNGGANVHIRHCYINDIGSTGVLLTGGDRMTLRPSNNSVEDTLIENFGQVDRTYAPGVRLNGVGNAVVRSEITCGPHAAIIFSGNDLTIRDNLIYEVASDTSDAGAVYGGRDWTQRGTKISGNLFYAIEPKVAGGYVVAVYLDDQLSGTDVSGNVFLNTPISILIGGGRDNNIRQNAFLSAGPPPIRMDQRGLSFERSGTPIFTTLLEKLNAVPYRSDAYAKYLGLSDIMTRLGEPTGNVVSENLYLADQIVAFDRADTAHDLTAEGNHVAAASQTEGASSSSMGLSGLWPLFESPSMRQTLSPLPEAAAHVVALEAIARSLDQMRTGWRNGSVPSSPGCTPLN